MNETQTADSTLKQLLDQMVGARQLSSTDAAALERLSRSGAAAPVQTQDGILQWLADQYDVAYSTLDDIEPDRELLSLFPARVLLKEELLPLKRTNGTVEVATSRLYATQGLDTLKTLTGLKIKRVLAPSEAIQREMKKHLGVGADTIDTLEEDAPLQVLDEDHDDGNLDEAAEDASIIKFVNQVLTDAVELRASDIHLEPFEDEFRIRYRIDGVLQEVPVPPQLKRFQPAIVSRVKILSHLNIAEKRLPQDGRIKIRLTGNEVDIRVSVIPMLHGEAVVLRLLRQNQNQNLGMSQLGMDERVLASFKRVIQLPHGIILVTGPTGSGKTTTLYIALSAINDSETKIITIEDPIEYQLKGVNQIGVNEKSGLTFARGLRSILRHDPDVVLIGEIRDTETAQIAVQASLTGHLVFSTLHTNDAPGAVTRLVDMKVEPYLVASSLEAVLAQRLVRVLCKECKAEDSSPTTAAIKEQLGFPRDLKVYKAVGCRACRNTGYHGRHGIFEWMDMNAEIQERVLKNCSSGEIREAALRNGLRSLSDDGWRLVRQGITTPEEVMRATKDQTLGANARDEIKATVEEQSTDKRNGLVSL
ncbi:MAG TPA: GspE/PulE family protein [Verrucomicrobiae bacterium]|nr:GspE/PulE family protein [Verrucomicrobiae bacterium]